MSKINVSIIARSLVRITLIIILIISSINSQELPIIKNKRINSHWAAGIEYAKNSELGILGQYNLNENISLLLKVRRCTHDKKIYFMPEVKYYFNKNIYNILPFINIMYGKLHYDLSWSSTYINYDYDVVYVWDASIGQMAPMVVINYSASSASGSTIINTRALSLSGGGEYIINNFGFNTTLGMSHYTKIEGDFKNKNKFFFTLSILYYFNK